MAKIGRYEVTQELGEGKMAAVYLARDPYIKRQVAIKVMAYQFTQDTLYRHFFYQEAEAIAALEHPYIVPIYDFGQHGVQPYIVMRHMANGSLESRLQKRGLNLRELGDLMGRLADGLDKAHAQGIVHRDVKPSNILFNRAQEAFLSDFGLAQFRERPSTITGSLLVGTPAFMSPEQIQRKQLDGRSDVYALGVILFLILTGQLPYKHKSPFHTASAHLYAPIPSVHALRPELPELWDEIIAQALAKAPEDRYESASAMSRDVAYATSRQWHLRTIPTA